MSGREVLEELVERESGFEVIDQGIHGDARAAEDEGTADDFRIGRDGKLSQLGLVTVHWGSASSYAQVGAPVGSSARDHRVLGLVAAQSRSPGTRPGTSTGSPPTARRSHER